MQGVQPIKLKEALKQMAAQDESGQPRAFQLSFYPASRDFKHFKRITIPRAVRCGFARPLQKLFLTAIPKYMAKTQIYSYQIDFESLATRQLKSSAHT